VTDDAQTMKVVLFCGGLGLRMREASERVPKPMVPIGGRPILWHVMKYFAHFGHKRFVVCLGFKGEVIKEYFLTYNEALSNDFVLRDGGRDIELLRHDIQDWEITFVDTGLHTSIGQRLSAVRTHLQGARFLANYGDVLTDAHLPDLVENHRTSGAVASFLCVKPGYTFHLVQTDARDYVHSVVDTTHSELWINGGYFVFEPEIFDYIEPGEDLVEQPFARLSAANLLFANKYQGFWAPMDTLKDQQRLEQMVDSGNGPWKLWELDGADAEVEPSSAESPVERA
jgi:glucose-1-phosphate cytidylyltransferase